MHSIRDGVSLARALDSPMNQHIKDLVRTRRDQLGGDIGEQAHFVIFEAGDTLTSLGEALAFSVLQNPTDGSQYGDADYSPGWEWIEDHGFAYEIVFIFTDDGFAHVVIVEKRKGVNASLLELCATYASKYT